MSVLNAGDVALVTGGTGFVGRALCRALGERGVRVRALARRRREGPWEELVEVDLGTAVSLHASVFDGVDTVFHLAGRAHATSERAGDSVLYERVNVEGTRVVADAARGAGVRALVLASSVKAMGEGSAEVEDEDTPPAPVTPYGCSKLAAETIVLAAARAGMHACVLRLPLVYGPGVGGNLARMLGAIRSGWMPDLRVPANARSMVDVRDVADAAMLLARREEARARVYIVTDGEEYSTARVDQAMRRALGAGPPRFALPWRLLRTAAAAGELGARLAGRRMPFDAAALRALCGSARYDGGRLRRELGFSPRWTLERALAQLCAPGSGAGPAV